MKSDILNGILLLIVGCLAFLFEYKYPSQNDSIYNRWRIYGVAFCGFIGAVYFFLKILINLFT